MENIILGSFDFDMSRLENSIRSYQKTLLDLQKEQQRHTTALRTLQTEQNKLIGQKQALVQAGNAESEEYKKIMQSLANLQREEQKQFSTLKAVQQRLSEVNDEYKIATSIQKSVQQEIKNVEQRQNELTNAINREITTIDQARKSNAELLKLRNNININNKENAETLAELNRKIEENNAFIKENVTALERQKINIGNYTESIREAVGNINPFNGGLSAFVQRSQEAGGAGKLFTNSLKGVATGVAGVTKSMLVFIATPIGAVLALIAGAFLLIKNAMDKSVESSSKLNTVFSKLSAMFNVVLKALEPLGTLLIDGIVAGFELATKAAEKTMNTLADMLEYVGFEKQAESVRNLNNGIQESIKNAQKLSDLQTKFNKETVAYNNAVGEQKELFKEQNKIAEDTTKTLQEREQAVRKSIEASRELLEIEKKRLENEREIALMQESDATKREILASEYNKKLKELSASQIEQETTQNNKLNTIRQEAHNNYLKMLNEQIKKQKEQLELWLTKQGTQAKTLEEELKILEDTETRKREILKKELQAGNLSREKYEQENLLITQEISKKRAEITVENANRELQATIENNQSKLQQNQLLTDQLLKQELDRERLLAEAKQQYEDARYQNGIINHTEYLDNIAKIDKDYLSKETELKSKAQQQQQAQARELQNLEFEYKIGKMQEEGVLEFDIQREIQEQKNTKEREELERKHSEGLISEEVYKQSVLNLEQEHAQALSQIEAEKQAFKLNVASQTFSNLAKILGENSKAGKAMAIAQTTIETYQSAVMAYKSMASIPVVGPALGAVAAAGAVASGLATVKKITNTPLPSTQPPQTHFEIQGYATGGIISKGVPIQRNNGDNVLITAQTGEVILNKKQQAYIGSEVLRTAGVPGFATGGVVGGVQPTLLKNVQATFDSVLNTEKIAEAVRNGAMQGSLEGSINGTSRGIVNLSENRLVQQNASF